MIRISATHPMTLALLALGAMTAKAVSYPPRPSLPHPNAFDDFAAAGRMLNEKLLGPKVVIRDPGGLTHKDYPLTRKALYVRASAAALKRLRHGFARPFLFSKIKDPTVSMRIYSDIRSLARLLLYDEQMKASRKDWSGVATDGLDAIRLGATFPRGNVLIGSLVGNACEAIGRKPVWDAIDPLSASQARACARRMEAIMSRRVPFSDTIIEEKRLNRLNSPLAQLSAEDGRQNSWVNPNESFVMKYLQSIIDKRTDEFIQIARRPYASRPPLTPAKEGDPNYLADLMIPVYYKGWFKERFATAQDGLLEVAFALRAYREERGAYPLSLSSLVPSYLSKLPEDPFARSGSFIYQKKGDRYLLYSIGPDDKDDGGKPAEFADTSNSVPLSSLNRFNVSYESAGDVVAGINR